MDKWRTGRRCPARVNGFLRLMSCRGFAPHVTLELEFASVAGLTSIPAGACFALALASRRFLRSSISNLYNAGMSTTSPPGTRSAMSTRAAVRKKFMGLLCHRHCSEACDGKHTVAPDRGSIRCISGEVPVSID
jgi:hypothetical protein